MVDELRRLLAALHPDLHPDPYVFARVPVSPPAGEGRTDAGGAAAGAHVPVSAPAGGAGEGGGGPDADARVPVSPPAGEGRTGAGGAAAGAGMPDAFAVVREEECLTVVLRRADADAAGLPYHYVAARITLRVRSDLAAVGLTAAVSTRLATAGISCNVLAGYAHDHLFVPYERGTEARAVLLGLAAENAIG